MWNLKQLIPASLLLFALNIEAQGTWATKASMPTARNVAATGTVNGMLYVVGGNGTTSCVTTVEAYDPGTNTWTTKAPMPTARTQFGVAEVNGILYAVGGLTCGSQQLATVEAYDPATNTWTTKAPMPTARGSFTLRAVNGVLYAVGGLYYVGPNGFLTAAVEAYDPATNTWTTRAPMPTALYGRGAGVVNGVLYALGGSLITGTLVSAVEAYDPVTNTWTPKAPLPTQRAFGWAVGTINGMLYATGGNNSSGIDPTLVAYDPSTNTWSTKTSMPTPRVNLGGEAINGVLYAVGGGNDSATYLATMEAYTPPPAAPLLTAPAQNAVNVPLTTNLTWNASFGATTYRVQLSTSASFSSILVDDSILTATTKAVGPFAASTIYYWRIKAANGGGISPWSDTWSFTTLPAVPAVPTLISPAQNATILSTSTNLSWASSAGATSYHVQVSTNSGFTSTVINDSTLTATTRAFGSFSYNTVYYWRVSAKNAGGTSAYSTTGIFNTGTTAILPKDFALQQLNLEKGQSLSFSLPQRAHVVIRILNTQGRVISQLLDETREAGNYIVPLSSEMRGKHYLLDFRTDGFHKTFQLQGR